jgi:chromosome partitioning protein
VRKIPVITFAHHKGGTGKTTSCLNVAGFLQKLGKRVLVIDLDPQANATSGLGVDPHTLPLSVYDLFMGQFEGFPDVAIQDVVSETRSGVFLAPSTLDLVGIEPFLYNIEHRATVLKKILSRDSPEYDFILIDTPPSMGQLVINGLIAAEHTVVTFDRGIFALHGLDTLMTIFSDIEELLGEHVSPDMAILTRWDDPEKEGSQGILSRLAEHFKTPDPELARDREQLKTFEAEVRTRFTDVFIIPYSREIYEAQNAGLPISHFAPECEAAKAYRKIAGAISGWKDEQDRVSAATDRGQEGQ